MRRGRKPSKTSETKCAQMPLSTRVTRQIRGIRPFWGGYTFVAKMPSPEVIALPRTVMA